MEEEKKDIVFVLIQCEFDDGRLYARVIGVYDKIEDANKVKDSYDPFINDIHYGEEYKLIINKVVKNKIKYFDPEHY